MRIEIVFTGSTYPGFLEIEKSINDKGQTVWVLESHQIKEVTTHR